MLRVVACLLRLGIVACLRVACLVVVVVWCGLAVSCSVLPGALPLLTPRGRVSGSCALVVWSWCTLVSRSGRDNITV